MRLVNHPAFLLLPVVLCLSALGAARADTIPFNGTRYENQPAASAGRCAPVPTLTVNNVIGVATGSSDLGNFTVDEVACLNTPFPAAITDGTFTWTFSDGGTIEGTWSGYDTRVTIPTGHLLTINETYLVTVGTGAFLGSTGSILETGLGNSNGVFSINSFEFTGSLTGPDLIATPEPTPILLLITGALLLCQRVRGPRAARDPNLGGGPLLL